MMITPNFLAAFTREQIWCRPAIDSRVIVKPARITGADGELYSVEITGHSITLPDSTNWWHVFQLGSFDLRRFGINAGWVGWLSLTDYVNKYNLYACVYAAGGRAVPLSTVYMRLLNNGCVAIAVRDVAGLVNAGVEPIFIRFYNGAFKNTDEFTAEFANRSASRVISTASDRVEWIRTLQELSTIGHTFSYVNGKLKRNLTVNDLQIGDLVEYTHDALVYSSVEFTLADLPSFTSALDSMKKYVLHPPKGTFSDLSSSYINDLELVVWHENEGRHYNVHLSSAIRQLTHRDYSIPADFVQRYLTENDGWINDSVTLQVYVRRSGFNYPLPYVSNCIHELYKLNDADIIGALAGINAVVPVWRAATLEQSAYAKIMSSKADNITDALAVDCLGYDSISRIVADSPVMTAGVTPQAKLGALAAQGCTVFEYDAAGVLLGYRLVLDLDKDYYDCQFPNTALVEVVIGVGGDSLSITYGASVYQTLDGYSYRFYTDVLNNGVPTHTYTDITGDASKVSTDPNGVVVWSIDQTRRLPVVWSDERFLAYDLVEQLDDGVLKFSVVHYRPDIDATEPLYLEPESLELWLNGHPLIYKLDYNCEWPQVVICNREWLVPGSAQRITVRCRGLAKSLAQPEYGWVIGGYLSNNDKFDVRDDKVVRIVVDGRLVDRSTVKFAEDAIAVTVDSAYEGRPYSVASPTIPLRTIVPADTYELRAAANTNNAVIESYLTAKLPQAPTVDTSVLATKYMLFSPLLTQLITHLKAGLLLPVQDDDTNYVSTKQFDELMEPYLYLINYEPTINGVDTRYAGVLPYWADGIVELSTLQYSIVSRANLRYLNNQISLNKTIKIVEV